MTLEKLSPEQVLSLLSSRIWRGFLAVVDDNRPYCFPVAHVVHNNMLYFLFTKYGRKTRALEKNNNVCYACLERVENMYISVIVEGRLEKEKDIEVLKQVVDKFIREIFPRDPYFKGFSSDRDTIVQMIVDGKIPGVYKLVIHNVDALIVRE